MIANRQPTEFSLRSLRGPAASPALGDDAWTCGRLLHPALLGYRGGMSSTTAARTALRAATADHHDRVDALFSRIDLTDRHEYGRFLYAQAAAHLPVEAALSAAGAAAVLSDWPERLRALDLCADLAALGLQPPSGPEIIDFDGPAAILGGVYVLEGSRLGGRMLARSLPPGAPRSFLDAGNSAMWRRFLDLLEAKLSNDAARRDAADAAMRVFASFETAATRLR